MTLTASVDGATLPAEVTFTAEDRGVKAVQITLPNATGPITITATDSADATLTASARINVIDLPFRGGFGSRLFTLGR
jgi:hypothetical protein